MEHRFGVGRMITPAAPWPAVAVIACIGLVTGSFLNVVILRVPRAESIAFPPSHCTSCKTTIRRRHNVPVIGWLVLHGRCAACGESISRRYPAVEVMTAALFAAVTMRFGLSPQLPAYLYLAALGITVAWIDFDVRRVPESIVLPSYVVSLLLLMPAGAAGDNWWPAGRGIIGMAALSIIYFALMIAYPTSINFGDIMLAGLLGLYLGWLSWAAILVGTFGGLMIGALCGMTVVANQRRHQAQRRHSVIVVAYGSCLVSAAGLALFVTVPLTAWYASLMSSI
jgi:leader peptidase (prepilin peptidase) / N-methyltransferase